MYRLAYLKLVKMYQLEDEEYFFKTEIFSKKLVPTAINRKSVGYDSRFNFSTNSRNKVTCPNYGCNCAEPTVVWSPHTPPSLSSLPCTRVDYVTGIRHPGRDYFLKKLKPCLHIMWFWSKSQPFKLQFRTNLWLCENALLEEVIPKQKLTNQDRLKSPQQVK